MILVTLLWPVAFIFCLFFVFKPKQSWPLFANRGRAAGMLAVSAILPVFIIGGLAIGAAGDLEKLAAQSENASPQHAATKPAVQPQPAPIPFGETNHERNAREAALLGDRWVKVSRTSEHNGPGGPVENRTYYGQKYTVLERQGGWYRISPNRWVRASDLSETEPPKMAEYAGPEQYRDSRIEAGAISNPGEDGLTKTDIDNLYRGAKMVLDSRPNCGTIQFSGKSLSRANTYYVNCSNLPSNVFFTTNDLRNAR